MFGTRGRICLPSGGFRCCGCSAVEQGLRGTSYDHFLKVPSEPASDRSSIERYRLLLVEDDRDALVAAAHLLEDGGFIVELAKNAGDAIVKAAALRPDIIVTDLVMPHLTGEDLVRELQRRRTTRRIPVIVYTAITDAQHLARLVRLNVRVFAIKPCVPMVVAAEAHRLLQELTRDFPVRVVTGYGETLDDLASQLRAVS
jgi:CheY-like chemotaxis protein